MFYKYASLRNLVSRFKDKPHFNLRISSRIFAWAKDDELSLSDFAFLTKKALNYIKRT